MKYVGLIVLSVLSRPRLASQAASDNIKVKLDPLTDRGMLLIVEKGIRDRMCHAIHGYGWANSKYIKDYDKNKESLYLNYLDENNSYGWEMS